MGFSSRVFLVALVVAGLFVVGAGVAHADTITFDEGAGTETSVSGKLVAWTEGAYEIVTDTNFFFLEINGGRDIFFPGATTLTLQRTDGAAFDLTSIDVTGTYGNGLVISASGHSDAVFTNYGLDLVLTFTDVTSVTFSNSNTAAIHGNRFDNLIVSGGGGASPVPEPGTWALMGLGVLGLAYQRKRKMAKAS